MARTGYTWCSTSNKDADMNKYGCMEFILDVSNKFFLFFTNKSTHIINKNLIDWWIDFGNKTIFPSELIKKNIKTESEKNILREMILNSPNINLRNYKISKINFKRRELEIYHQGDAIEADIVKPIAYTIDRSNNILKIVTTILKSNTRPGCTWYVRGEDFYDPKSGKTMLQLLEEEISSTNNGTDEDILYKLQVDPAKISKKYKLAIVSFLRILWHDDYVGFVEKIHELVESGIDRWDAFYMVNSLPEYRRVSHFTPFCGFRNMEDVRISLNSGKYNINGSFQPNHQIESPGKYAQLFKEDKQKALMYLTRTTQGLNVKCINNRNAEKSLTLDKIYSGYFSENFKTVCLIEDDTYSKRHFKAERFSTLN